MNTNRSLNLFALLLCATFALGPALRAQENPPAPPTPPPEVKKSDQPPPAPDAAPTAVTTPPATPAAKPADATVTTPPAAAAATATPSAEAPKTSAETKSEATPATGEKVATPAPEDKGQAKDEDEETPKPHRPSRVHHGHGDNERVGFFQDNTLAAGEHADAVVSVFGSSTSAGEVSDAVVSVFGSSTSSGSVGDAVVSVLGDTKVSGGSVGNAAVAVGGSTTVNGHVHGDVVAILGNVELGPDAVVDGQVVCVGGHVNRDAKATLHGNVQNIAIGGRHFDFTGLRTWFSRCLLYARPLAFDSHLLWAWCIAFLFLGLYAVVSLIAPSGVNQCVRTLEERPGKSLLAALLVILITPVVYLLLVLTLALVIGFVLIPLLSLGLFFAGIFGRVVLLAWIGRRITKLFGDGPLAAPFFAVLIGGLIVMLLYTVPILGFVVYKLLGILGVGVVLYTLLLSYKESRAKAAAATAAANAATAAARAEAAAAAAAASATTGEATAVPPIVPAAMPPISAATLPRAGFWIRVAAVLLDAILVGLVFGLLPHFLRPLGGGFPLWFGLYHVIMWAAKGTTIGGIICGLKVVRLDDRPLDWGTSAVRACGALLSLAVAGLGFIWVAFDAEQQSWHDKIAGTTIVKVPKGTPLL